MGWKSTIDITREEAIKAIVEKMAILHDKTNLELEEMLEDHGFGDDTSLRWYGHNFIITD